MRRRDPTILIALFIALIVHLVVLGAGVRAARRQLGWWLQPPGTNGQPAPQFATPLPQDPMERLGQHTGTGSSVDPSPGNRPLQATVADAQQEQALLTTDPGLGGSNHNRQLEQALRGDNGDGAPRGSKAAAPQSTSMFDSREAALAAPTPKSTRTLPLKVALAKTVTPPAPVDPAAAKSNTPPGEDPLSSGPLAMKPPSKDPIGAPKATDPSAEKTATQTPQQQQEQQQQEQQQASANAGGVGGTPGSDPAAGDPLPASDSESVPVTHIAGRFIDGRIDARMGRKMRRREIPHLGLAAYADLATMENTYVVLNLKIDNTGNVIDVQVTRSSGSSNLDDPCKRAAFSWWFEPLKDARTGQVRQSEEIEFTIFF